jgi:hypothetical protein
VFLNTKLISLFFSRAGYILSAVFICWEYQRLGIHHRQHRVLRISFWVKLTFIFVEAALAIAFGVLSKKSHWNEAAVVEWVIAFIYAFFVWSFAIDFLPATRKRQYTSKDAKAELGMTMGQGAGQRGWQGGVADEGPVPRNF